MFETLKTFWKTCRLKTEESRRSYAQSRISSVPMMYLWTLIILLAMSLLSVPALFYGIYYDSKLWIMTGGIWRAMFTILLAIVAAPFAVIIEAATGGIKGSGKRYVNRVASFFVAELVFTFLICVIPIKTDLEMFPVFILALFIFSLTGASIVGRKTVGVVFGIITLILGLRFVVLHVAPTAVAAASGKWDRIEKDLNKPELVMIKMKDLEEGRVEFFLNDKEATAKVFYARLPDDKYELYDREGYHPGLKIKLKPMISEVAFAIMSKKEQVLSTRNIADKPEENIAKDETPPPANPQIPPSPPPIDRNAVPDQPEQKIIPLTPAVPEDPPKVEPTPEPVKRYKYAALVIGTSGKSEKKSSREVASWFGPDGTSASKILPNASFSDKKLSENDRQKLEGIAENIVLLRYSIVPSQSRLASIHYTCKMEARIIDAKTGDTKKVVRKEFGSSGLTEESARKASKRTTLESVKNELMQ